MMRALAAGLVLAMAVDVAPAAAQDIGGTYRVAGTNANGSTYAGTAVVVATSKNTCRIEWNVGSISTGICMRYNNAFTAGYVLGDAVGLVIYQVFPDGRMEGIWTVADQGGVGTEVLTPLR